VPYLNASELVLPAHATVTGSSNPNSAAVATMIAEVEGELDAAAAAAGYTVPLAPPASGGATIGYQQIVGYAKKGVTARVLSVMFPNLPGGPGARTTLGDDFRKEYLEALKLIREGKLPLVGAGSDSGGSGRELPRSYSVSNGTATSGVVSQMSVGREF
jgi:hypothetical protein